MRTNHYGHNSYINTVTVSPDGSLCASGGRDGKAMLWDLNDGKHLYTLESGDIINSLCFSPNRYWLCAGKRKVNVILMITFVRSTLFQPVVHQLKSGIWKRKQSLMKSNQKNNVHHWHGPLMVKHCLLVLPTNKFEYSKFDNVKLINKTTIKEEYLTSIRTTVLFLFDRLIFLLRVVVIRRKKE